MVASGSHGSIKYRSLSYHSLSFSAESVCLSGPTSQLIWAEGLFGSWLGGVLALGQVGDEVVRDLAGEGSSRRGVARLQAGVAVSTA